MPKKRNTVKMKKINEEKPDETFIISHVWNFKSALCYLEFI